MSIADNLHTLGALMKTNLENKGIRYLNSNMGLTTLANKINDIRTTVSYELYLEYHGRLPVVDKCYFTATLYAVYTDTNGIVVRSPVPNELLVFYTGSTSPQLIGDYYSGNIIGTDITDENGEATIFVDFNDVALLNGEIRVQYNYGNGLFARDYVVLTQDTVSDLRFGYTNDDVYIKTLFANSSITRNGTLYFEAYGKKHRISDVNESFTNNLEVIIDFDLLYDLITSYTFEGKFYIIWEDGSQTNKIIINAIVGSNGDKKIFLYDEMFYGIQKQSLGALPNYDGFQILLSEQFCYMEIIYGTNDISYNYGGRVIEENYERDIEIRGTFNQQYLILNIRNTNNIDEIDLSKLKLNTGSGISFYVNLFKFDKIPLYEG